MKKTDTTLTCQICGQAGLHAIPPGRRHGRRITLHSNEWVSHVVQGGRHYLVRERITEELPELVLN